MSDDILLIDDPRPMVRRLTLNRPEKRNAMSNALRARLFEALEDADLDPDVRVTVIRGAGPSFCSGYDLSADLEADRPYHTARGHQSWSRFCTRPPEALSALTSVMAVRTGAVVKASEDLGTKSE